MLRRRRAFQGDNLNATELRSLQAEPIAQFNEKSVFRRMYVFEAKRSGVNHLTCVAEKEHSSGRWLITQEPFDSKIVIRAARAWRAVLTYTPN